MLSFLTYLSYISKTMLDFHLPYSIMLDLPSIIDLQLFLNRLNCFTINITSESKSRVCHQVQDRFEGRNDGDEAGRSNREQVSGLAL